MRKTGNKKRLLLLAAVLLIICGGLGYWKRRGIRNTVLRIAGIQVPRYRQKVTGYYGQAVKLSPELHNDAVIAENDDTFSNVVSNIPTVSTAVAFTRQIDEQLQQELDNGQYTPDDPMVIMDPFQASPLTAVALFQTEEPTAVHCTVKGKTAAADLSYDTPVQTRHLVPLIGLYPSFANKVVLELQDESGRTVSETELEVTTSGLPEGMDGMVEPVINSGSSAYGLTMVYGQKCLNPFAYDCNGEIRWYLSKESGFYGCYNLSDGRFIMQDAFSYSPSLSKPQTTNVCEMDYLGRTYRIYCLPFGFHHEIKEMEPGGNLLCLSSSMEEHYEDVILELDRQTGEVMNYLKLSDLFINSYTGKLDWAHLNTVSYQAEDDTILISARNVHSVMKIGWTDHELKWILCDPAFWKGKKCEKYVLAPTDDFIWHYEQHTAYRITEDLDEDPDTVEISVFDNHINDHRPVETFTDTGSSYVTVYAVNEKERTVSLLRQFEILKSEICSDTVYDAESGHIFGMAGIIEEEAWNGYRGMNYEFDYETGELINRFAIRDQFYRSTQMELNVMTMCGEEEKQENYLLGSMPQPVETAKKVPEPAGVLQGKVSLSRTGSILYVNTLNHRVSQVIFLGEDHTFVYDITAVIMESSNYLDFQANMPVTMKNLPPDTYRILCVYENTLYRLEQDGEDSYITI